MASRNRTPLESALQRLLRDRDRDVGPPRAPGVRRSRAMARRAPMRPSSTVVQRELDWFRRGQALAYWQHDRRSD